MRERPMPTAVVADVGWVNGLAARARSDGQGRP